MQMEKMIYFAESAWKRARFSNMTCPNCGSARAQTLDRKYVLVELRRCQDCKLMFRAPTDSAEDNRKFYQVRYTEGFTTETPSASELDSMKAVKFEGTGKSYQYYISVLQALGLPAKARVFDYGCSWGYGSWQFGDAGFDVTACEISGPRAAYAREKLGVNVIPELPSASNPGALKNAFDVFFSSHVMEHVPKPTEMLRIASALVKPGGYFVIFTPNGSLEHRARHPQNWHTNWGKVHPNMIDEEFYRHALTGKQMVVGASPAPADEIARFSREGQSAQLSLDGDELYCIVRC